HHDSPRPHPHTGGGVDRRGARRHPRALAGRPGHRHPDIGRRSRAGGRAGPHAGDRAGGDPGGRGLARRHPDDGAPRRGLLGGLQLRSHPPPPGCHRRAGAGRGFDARRARPRRAARGGDRHGAGRGDHGRRRRPARRLLGGGGRGRHRPRHVRRVRPHGRRRGRHHPRARVR
ncbi:unnamed protein product, partial [Penicillium discolor]